MTRQTPLLLLLAMNAFAANSLLCRMALKYTLIYAIQAELVEAL